MKTIPLPLSSRPEEVRYQAAGEEDGGTQDQPPAPMLSKLCQALKPVRGSG